MKKQKYDLPNDDDLNTMGSNPEKNSLKYKHKQMKNMYKSS